MEIEKPYPRSPLRKHMEYVIADLPKKKGLTKEHIKPGARYAFDQIDDEKIVWDDSSNKASYIKWGLGFVGFYFFWVLILSIRNPEEVLWVFLYVSVFLIPAIYCFIYWKYEPEKKAIIFHRLEGTIQLPGILADRPHLIKFDELHAALGISLHFMHLDARRNRNWWDRMWEGVSLKMGSWSPEESWSYWVWYMDKNRPLPPGSAFDTYRKKDFERRKAEGFPAPFYKSLIPTPEYVPGSEGSIVDK